MAPFIGLVPFAGQDPLFWLHHANIDRLWECWTQKHGREQNPLTNTDWMNREYVFVDENGDRVTMKVAELFDPNGRIDYAYDNASQCFRVEPPAGEAVIAAFRERANPGTVAATASTLSRSEVALASSVSVKELEQNIGLISSSAMLNQSERAVLMAVRPNVLQPTRAILRLEDVEIGKAMGLSVRVFVTNRRTSARGLKHIGPYSHEHGPLRLVQHRRG